MLGWEPLGRTGFLGVTRQSDPQELSPQPLSGAPWRQRLAFDDVPVNPVLRGVLTRNVLVASKDRSNLISG